jgi:hypothetical protein
MSKLGHNNLFRYAADRAEVYETFQRDFNRDTWIQSFWHVFIVGMALGAAYVSNHPDWLWLFGAIYAAERAASRFVDNSNRNWAMHVIDWLENNRHNDAA